MAAERLAEAGVSVRAFERMPSVGRKFLLAGRGGLNLTHSEPTDRLLARYGEAAGRLAAPIGAFPAEALRDWCAGLGVETFVGSSGRIFPKSLKASPLLRAWLARLGGLGVRIETRRRWTGFTDDGRLLFETPSGPEAVGADVVVLALGGASWPRLGGDGGWVSPLAEAGVSVKPLKPANCGFFTRWSSVFAQRFAGAPLKRAALSFEGETVRGEAVVTADGIEGGLIYALAAALRDAIERDGEAVASLDLRPDLDIDALAERLSRPRGKRSFSTHLSKTASLPPVAVALLREAGTHPPGPVEISRRIKALPLRLTAPKPVERAISTAGGVEFAELDEGFMLRRRPGVFLAGEMLDWEAPTGGYLLQACFATGRAAGDAAARWLAARAAA
ncbi:TIGR03862 family flavoprotein [Hansschlegelia zhihuaiae]|uniref:TIGR03862 family flavoprotein n=2 Tax=Hansschlegelia zhihuaiae TaxID=405005 RepID=A0A4V1KIW8_9HYPH|nr:TIGR03862 family flavoprotein [Hansschlegelia zhihuaiae]